MSSILAVRAELTAVAGARRAEVETMAGWLPVEKWTPYGATEPKTIEFRFDAQTMRIREDLTEYGRAMRARIMDDKCITGVWPVRFVEVGR